MNAPEPARLFGSLPHLPRDAGGPVFAEPWQAQAFALALQLHAQGAFSWPEWADALSARLKAAGPADDGSRYYEHWLATLEDLVTARALATAPELSARKDAWEHAYRRTAHGRPVELVGEP
ncbi:nitrile hydratase accessory protein [Phenylobacterium sp.]|uniref:nitrile hydratase accessory protein n=1 Tax=Phenylobacterium sp. TaxID=1871053 RepID=UPI002C2EC244|nr:nitrile hydratase accessory protein [Phenylobacterium sp.]HLZ73830.1 nitrile hydratase accessory protein [Phenylobacterium sp.]